ncbi:hypothetical protein [Streptomyces sp. NBC_00829]|uniref:hypothetical protein n=1 Tax=Streptomyces sp. NBC_00829 TaxID=2903679 RepID=UPI0038695717|nr:hypothetical protein OG293_20475 [Streptomyces sp. NBC_00829]
MVIAEAASLVAPAQMPALYEQAAKAQGKHLALKVTNKLPKEDPLGAVPGIAMFVLMVAGYLGATLACSAPALRQPPFASLPSWATPSSPALSST